MPEYNRRITDVPEGLTQTKEKILFQTNELVMSLNTQVAVLKQSNDELKATVTTYMEKMDKVLDRADERHATLDQRVTILRTDMASVQADIRNLHNDIEDARANDLWQKLALLVGTIIAGTIAWFKS